MLERALGSLSGSSPDYQLVRRIFLAALERSESERTEWVRAECGDDDALYAEVETLLANNISGDGFLSGGADEALRELAQAAPMPPPVPPPVAPSRVGPFRVLRMLGSGGMGVVYLAEQERTRRQVALKILADCGDEQARRRFEREIYALAQLQHSGIAQVYEAGVATIDSIEVPYFAMEHVDGVSLLKHCKSKGLDARARLTLFAEVCDAVQHAHQRDILHRDLKPDNVLVDGRGRPRVVDFGLALLMGPESRSRITRTGHLLGTFVYMSPEQANDETVDARSDQYALGVLAYELLTGSLPFEVPGGQLQSALRRLSREAPIPMSERDASWRGDVQTIVHKALDPDPARRYSSVAALADDVRRYLSGQPILARPASTAYVLRRFVRQHRVLATSVVLTVVALSVSLLVAIEGWRDARRAESVLAQERDVLRRLSHSQLIQSLDEEVDVLWPVGPKLIEPIRTWLDRADGVREHVPAHRAYLANLNELDARGEREGATTTRDSVPGGMQSFVDELGRFFADDEKAPYRLMKRRLEFCEKLETRTVEAYRAEWDATLAGLADPARYPMYRGLTIEPQIGLVPLGPDPVSHLFEFALDGPTGEPPERDPETGCIDNGPMSSFVFVLLPGGRVQIGAQRTTFEAPRWDPNARDHEGPPKWFDLDPFLISKYEATQGQWLAFYGDNPSYWADGKQFDELKMSLRHPVDMITHLQASEFCWRIGCLLPTEAQWEYAARGGTDTPYWCATDARGLLGFENVKNASFEQFGLTRAQIRERDPWWLNSTVGEYLPNAFGLHDVGGNVWELCRDVYKVEYFDFDHRPGDGLVLADGDSGRSRRGGGSGTGVVACRIAYRNDILEHDNNAGVGFRPIREITGPWSFSQDSPETCSQSDVRLRSSDRDASEAGAGR